jgi:hypothetical protein
MKLFSSVIERIVLILSLGVLLYAGVDAINEQGIWLRQSDETKSYSGLLHTVSTGVPLDAPRPESVMFDPDKEYDVYRSHRTISYLNVPVYYVLESLDISMEKWYGGWPFVLSMIILVLALAFQRSKTSARELAVLFLPTALSTWTLASLHYIRYYGYEYVFGIVCSFAAYQVYASSRPYWFRVSSVIILLLMPGLFHPTLYSLVAFGIMALAVDFFVSKVYKNYESKLILYAVVGGLASVVLLFALPFLRLAKILKRFGKELDLELTGQAISNYMKINNPEGLFWFMFNITLVFAGLYLSFRRKDFYGKFFRLSLGYFFFGLVLFSMLMGGDFNPPYGFNRYYLIIHIAYIICSGLLVYMAIDELLKRTSVEVPSSIPYALLIVLLFFGIGNVFSPYSMNDQNFSLVPRYKSGHLDALNKDVRKANRKEYDLVVVSGQSGLIRHYFPTAYTQRVTGRSDIGEVRQAALDHPDGVLFFIMMTKGIPRELDELIEYIYPEFED